METSRPQLLILARAPDAFCELFGVSLLERLLRIVQRLGFREAIILSDSIDEVSAHLAPSSWARADVALSFREQIAGAARINEVATGVDRTLVVSAGYYYDARLLKTLAERFSAAAGFGRIAERSRRRFQRGGLGRSGLALATRSRDRLALERNRGAHACAARRCKWVAAPRRTRALS
jgi:hypothetical protein